MHKLEDRSIAASCIVSHGDCVCQMWNAMNGYYATATGAAAAALPVANAVTDDAVSSKSLAVCSFLCLFVYSRPFWRSIMRIRAT